MDPGRRKIIHDAIVRLHDGDRTAFTALVDELWPVILTFAKRGVGQNADAEDIAQEVFLRICSRISDFDRSRDGLSWAFGIAAYEVMTHRRRRSRRREVGNVASDSPLATEAAPQEDELLEREISSALQLVLSTLTEDDRRALGVNDSLGTDSATGATLRKRKQRAIERLRSAWRSLYGEP